MTKTTEQRTHEARAELVRNVLYGKGPVVSSESRGLLDSLPGPGGGGNLLPINLSQTIVGRPKAENPLRPLITTTAIKGLEVPKGSFKIFDNNFVGDDDDANVAELAAHAVAFGRFKVRILSYISDTVMNGTPSEISNFIDNALQSGLAEKERSVMLAATPKTGEEHMSFYSNVNAIKRVTGSDLFSVIRAAIADLDSRYKTNASIIMSFENFSAILDALAERGAAAYGAAPENLLGKPVVFCDDAPYPIIGDFRYGHLNYDSGSFDKKKIATTGAHAFALTVWLDFRVLLPEAFRIVELEENDD